MHKDAIGLNIVQKPPFYWVIEWIFNTCCKLITEIAMYWNGISDGRWCPKENQKTVLKFAMTLREEGDFALLVFRFRRVEKQLRTSKKGDCWPFRDIAEFVYNTYYFSWTYVQESQCIHNNKLFSTYFFKAKIPKFIQTYYPSMWFLVIWYRCITKAISRYLVTFFIP